MMLIILLILLSNYDIFWLILMIFFLFLNMFLIKNKMFCWDEFYLILVRNLRKKWWVLRLFFECFLLVFLNKIYDEFRAGFCRKNDEFWRWFLKFFWSFFECFLWLIFIEKMSDFLFGLGHFFGRLEVVFEALLIGFWEVERHFFEVWRLGAGGLEKVEKSRKSAKKVPKNAKNSVFLMFFHLRGQDRRKDRFLRVRLFFTSKIKRECIFV